MELAHPFWPLTQPPGPPDHSPVSEHQTHVMGEGLRLDQSLPTNSIRLCHLRRLNSILTRAVGNRSSYGIQIGQVLNDDTGHLRAVRLTRCTEL